MDTQTIEQSTKDLQKKYIVLGEKIKININSVSAIDRRTLFYRLCYLKSAIERRILELDNLIISFDTDIQFRKRILYYLQSQLNDIEFFYFEMLQSGI